MAPYTVVDKYVVLLLAQQASVILKSELIPPPQRAIKPEESQTAGSQLTGERFDLDAAMYVYIVYNKLCYVYLQKNIRCPPRDI